MIFQSTLPAWGETGCRLPGDRGCCPISIHSPRMGRDEKKKMKKQQKTIFQSTLPAWGETEVANINKFFADFNPLSPHGERLGQRRQRRQRAGISIHSPRMGRDARATGKCSTATYFNPLSPHGERHDKTDFFRVSAYFNPLSPHGERPSHAENERRNNSFQSTLPAWGETRQDHASRELQPISIHSPRMGRDRRAVVMSQSERLFQSTLPAWGETPRGFQRQRMRHISIHSPRMGRDSASWKWPSKMGISIHSPRMGRDGIH